MLDKLTIRTRLTLAFGLMLLLMLVMAAAGLWSAQRFYGASETLYEKRARPLAQLGDIQLLVQRNRMLLLDMLNDPGSVQRNDRELVANLGTIDAQWKAYLGSGIEGPEADLAAVFQQRYQAYLKDALEPAATAMREGRYDDTAELFANRVTPAAPQVQEAVAQLVQWQVQQAENQFRSTGQLNRRLVIFLGAAALVALAVGALTARRITRSVTVPLKQAVDVALLVAEGDLRTQIEVTRQDETGALLRALGAMNSRLIEVVDRVRHASEGVSTGATEIAHGTADLSQRTEAQAANLEQTAASMDELSDTVKRNATAADEARQLVSQAERSAQAGGDEVAQVEATMNEIASSSQRMRDIISVIDAIAFQTNILALNAAVEAARAGEQGRGFAVVAAEVRTLAQRSAAAAREIRDLISTSLVHVQAGTERVGTASQSVRGVVDQVRHVSRLIQEIASASDAQSQGVSEVASAVDELDQATQHNAALVEETSAACESLRQQARELTEAVDVFRLPATALALASA